MKILETIALNFWAALIISILLIVCSLWVIYITYSTAVRVLCWIICIIFTCTLIASIYAGITMKSVRPVTAYDVSPRLEYQ